METTNIYVLQCAHGKYYVGKADDLEERIESHIAGTGAMWTKMHKPKRSIMQIIPNVGPFYEDLVVKEMMAEHGIDNVRGGSYSQIILTDEQQKFLQAEIYGAMDKCMRCGRSGHWVADCYAKSDTHGKILMVREQKTQPAASPPNDSQSQQVAPIQAEIIEKPKPKKLVAKCTRCDRFGHIAVDCYATTHADGQLVCARCDRAGHATKKCYASFHANGRKLE